METAQGGMPEFLIARAKLIVFGVLVGGLGLIGVFTVEEFRGASEARVLTEHTYEVLGEIKELDIAVGDAESSVRSFLLTGDDDMLEPYRKSLERVSGLGGSLQHQLSDNPGQSDRLRSLLTAVQRRLDGFASVVQLRRDKGLEAVLSRPTQGALALAQQIDATLAAMTTEENRLLAVRRAAADRRAVWTRSLVAAGGAVAALALAVAARMLRRAWWESHQAELEARSLTLQLRSALDSLSQGVALFTADRTLLNWNEGFQALLGLPKAMMRVGTPYSALAGHVAESGVTLETETQIQYGPTVDGVVVYEQTREGGMTLELRRTHSTSGGFVLTVTDMSMRAQAEAVLRESQKMQAIGQLTGGIAHDFNNLLTVILGNLEFVQRKLVDDPTMQQRIERAVWAAGRGATLTGQLLAFARKQPLAPAALDLAATLPDLVPLLRRTLGEHIEVRYVETAGLWPAMADPAQLENAVLNLALNARDAMPGGGRLTIELANKVLDETYVRTNSEAVAGDYTMVAVSDTGHGMTREVAARVFEPFYTTKPTGKGTGLGLAMVFGFVKQSGGHIKIYSEPGEGTTVRIYLPRAIGAATQAAPRISTPVELPRGSGTILVVEDEAGVREVAVSILQEHGYRVLEAADGDEGLLVFGAHAAAVDLLLTDVVLPGRIRGRDLAERITAMRPEITVLYMSGYTENSIVHHGRLDDGVQLISKPFKREQLVRKVGEIMAARPVAEPVEGGNVIALKTARET